MGVEPQGQVAAATPHEPTARYVVAGLQEPAYNLFRYIHPISLFQEINDNSAQFFFTVGDAGFDFEPKEFFDPGDEGNLFEFNPVLFGGDEPVGVVLTAPVAQEIGVQFVIDIMVAEDVMTDHLAAEFGQRILEGLGIADAAEGKDFFSLQLGRWMFGTVGTQQSNRLMLTVDDDFRRRFGFIFGILK